VQEALSNALQHACADLITVFVRWEQSTLAIEVRDNGVGFSPAARPDTYTNENHYGLVGLQERVRQVGGSLTIDAGPGRGTLVSVRLPTARYLPDS
jgi:signal transduction histidine kinase